MKFSVRQKKASSFKAPLFAALLGLLVGFGAQPGLADNESLDKGMAAYRAGNYSEAVDNLQAALSTDFNNAKLHYFLANAYVCLKQRDAGVREYRIAFALEPEREVGKLAKQALVNMGVDNEKPKEPENKEAEKKAPSDPVLDKATASLQQQAEQAKALNRSTGDAIASDIARRSADQLDRNKQQMLQDLSYYRRGRLIQLPLPPEAMKQLESLQQVYANQKNGYQDSSAKRSDEIQKSADNLSGLLNDKASVGPKLIPAGTNLYIRNYKSDASTSGQPPTSSSPATPTKPSR